MKYINLLIMDLKSEVFFYIYRKLLTKFGIMVLFINLSNTENKE